MNLEISHFSSCKILKQSTHRTINFSILVHIENFPSFVTSRAECRSVSIKFNNTEWYIKIELYKYCQTSKESIRVTSSSLDTPETLCVFVYGRRSDQKECSFDVNANFKLKQSSTAIEKQFLQTCKFSFDSTKQHDSWAWGFPKFARIDVFLKGFLFV